MYIHMYDTKLITSPYGCFPIAIENTKLIT